MRANDYPNANNNHNLYLVLGLMANCHRFVRGYLNYFIKKIIFFIN